MLKRTMGWARLALLALSGLLLASRGVAQDEIYAARENLAPPEVKAELSALRTRIEQEGLEYTVGFTDVSELPLERLTGARVPDDLGAQMRATNLRPPPPGGRATCDERAAKFDWSSQGKVSPVRHQGQCGSCWAFATVGALESGCLLRHNARIDASEQYVLSCADPQYSCAGGWWAFDLLQNRGTATEAAVPYRAADLRCPAGVSTPYRVAAWGYVDTTVGVPARDEIKEALCKHGPLAVGVIATDAWRHYTGGVFSDTSSGPINHALVLVGWDDTRGKDGRPKGAWHLKNSWGTVWGEQGYMWIRYDSSQLGFGAAWCEASACKPTLPAAQAAFVGAAAPASTNSADAPTVPSSCPPVAPRCR